MKQKKQMIKKRFNRNRDGPNPKVPLKQDDEYLQENGEPDANDSEQRSASEDAKQARKRRNRRNAHRIREQLSNTNRDFQKQKSDFIKEDKFGNVGFSDFRDEELHSAEASDLFKRSGSVEKASKKQRQRASYKFAQKGEASGWSDPDRRNQTEAGTDNKPQEQLTDLSGKRKQKLPGNKEYSLEKITDPKTGKTSYKMVLNRREETGKKGNSSIAAKTSRVTKEISAYAVDFLHAQNGEEDDNSGTEAAGFGLRTASRIRDHLTDKATGRFSKKGSRPDFKPENLFGEKKPDETPEQAKKALQKRIQKQRIKREYAQALRKSGNARKAAGYAEKAVKGTASAVKKMAEVIAGNIHVILIAAALILILFVIIIMVSSCAAVFSGGMGQVMTGSYQSLPAEIDKAENSMTLKEMRLQNKIDRIETDYPDYDEYTYNLAEIGHDPFMLINFLSAKYIDFTADGVESEIQYLFNHMYQLILTEREEERTRTVTKTRPVIDPETGLETGEEEEYEEEEEYTARILDVKLTSIPLEWIIRPRLQGETAEFFAIYSETKGAVQRFYTPLNLDWYSKIKSYYGYRKSPQTGVNEFHRGLDIAVPYGTDVYASQSGTVIAVSYTTDYGNYIVIEDSKGYMTKYAHLSSRYVSSGQTVEHGQLIGKTGSTGSITGSHLHIECLYNGDYYNPLFYFENGEVTFHASADAVTAAGGIQADMLLNVADSYVGYPYVWGGSSPDTGFDCSGFVCYVLKSSGYADIPRTTAQGIYDRCQRVSADEARPGDIIFFTGTYNSGHPVSHVGIYCGNGMMIHAGDPIKYSSINTPYWQSHFYGFGRSIH